MQRTKKRPDSMPGFQIGTSYLLVIFIILCLVTFAALALSSALRDQSYSQALAKHQTEYAAASTQASALLAQIDEALNQRHRSRHWKHLQELYLRSPFRFSGRTQNARYLKSLP